MAVSDIDLLAVATLEGVPCITTIPDTIVGPSPIQGRGLFAQRAFALGDVLCRLDGQVVDITRHPTVIDALEWNALTHELLLVRAIRTSYGFMNHRAHPNVVIDSGGYIVRVGRAIRPGDEMTIDYFAQPVPAAYRASREAQLLRGFA